MNDQKKPTAANEVVEVEVTVTPPITADQFITGLRNDGFTGNLSTNASMPGVVWVGFRNGI